MDVITNKYDDWSRVLLEPMSLNDARLFSLETRVTEEEEMRVKEYEYLRDLMKKLIYALEQINTVNITRTSGRDSLNVTGASFLPNLMNAGKDQPKSPQPEMDKTMEFMMLKRLNYLRNQLDSHEPVETTARMRLNAMQKRDERIIELWRKDTEMPTVQEIVAVMKTQRNHSERLDFPAIESKTDELMNDNVFKTQPSIGFPSVSDPLNQPSLQMHSFMSSTVQAEESQSKQKNRLYGKGSDPDVLAGASTQYPQESLNT